MAASPAPESRNSGGLIDRLLGRRTNARSWAYLLAAILPLVGIVDYWRGPYHFSLAYHGPAIGLLMLCLVQYVRPSVAGWAVVSGAYVYVSIALIAGEAQALSDAGSEDHSRFEGWSTTGLHLGIAALLVTLCVLLARRCPGAGLRATT